MFNENSGLVLLWVKFIKDGTYSNEQVPKLSNLQEAVQKVLENQNASTS